MMPKNGSRNVCMLGMVSLFTDLSSQMVYPLVPAFLAGLGVSKTLIGMIEGIAESTAALLRTVFGRWSDRTGRRKLFIVMGYGLSAVSKPLLYLARAWPMVLGVKFSDRVGKAIRTPARDALISMSVDPTRKGRAFGFHRAMDRLGAVGGPLLALWVLHLWRHSEGDHPVRMVFLFSVVPALLALAFVPFARETGQTLAARNPSVSSGLRSRSFLAFLVASIVFTLGNSSNAFLILKAREAGVRLALIPAVWVVYNLSCTVFAPLFGTLSDRVSRQAVIAVSFLYYAAVYVLFGLAQTPAAVWVLFAAYGVYYGLSDGVFRAYVADLVAPEQRATAYGIFNTGIGLALVPASVLFGAIWDAFGSRWAFFVSAGFSLAGFLVFAASLRWRKDTR